MTGKKLRLSINGFPVLAVMLFLLIGMEIFTKTDAVTGTIILLLTLCIWMISGIAVRKFSLYEVLFFLLAALLTGTNFLLYVGTALCGLDILVHLKEYKIIPDRLHIHYEILGFFVMLCAGTLSSILNATDQESADLYVGKYVILFVFFVCLQLCRQRMQIDEKKAVRLFACCSLLLGIGFFLTHTISQLFSTAHIFIYYISDYGVYSNTLAGIIAPFAVGCCLIVVESKDRVSRIIAVAADIMLIMILLAIQSRGAYLGILIALLWLCSKKKPSKVLTAMILAGIALILLSLIYPELLLKFFGRFRISHFTNGDFLNGRLPSYKIAWEMFCEHPLIGCGFWQFGVNGIREQDPHNFIFSYLASTGLIGVTGFVLFLVHIYRRINKNYEQRKEKYSGLLCEITMTAFWITVGQGLVEPTLSTSAPLSIFMLLVSLPIQKQNR